jgi:Bacterial regulatory helix-turn-helix protein, lysR family
MNRGDLAYLTAFVAVADHLSFRAAASRLGVTPSALSHSMRDLEERLGLRVAEPHDVLPRGGLPPSPGLLFRRPRPRRQPPTPCARPANVRAFVRDIAGAGRALAHQIGPERLLRRDLDGHSPEDSGGRTARSC